MHPQAVETIVRRGPFSPKLIPVLSPQLVKLSLAKAASPAQLSLAKAACSRASIDHVALGSWQYVS